VLVGSVTEVADGLSGVSLAAKQDRVGASGAPQGQLVQGEAFATSSQDASSGSGGEAEGGDRKLRHLKQSDIVSHGGDDHNSLSRGVFDSTSDARNGHGGSVDAAHV